MEIKPLLTVQQLQEALNVSRSTVYEMRKKGMPYKEIGKSVRFDYNEVMKWIDEGNAKEDK